MGWRELLALAARMAPKMRAAFLTAITRLRDALDLDGIADLLGDGRPATAILTADLSVLDHDLQLVTEQAQTAFIEAGTRAADALSSSTGMTIRFDVVNPHAVAIAQRINADLVGQVSTHTLAAVRALATRAVEGGLTRRDLARLIRPLIGLTKPQTLAVLSYREAQIALGTMAARADGLAATYADRMLKRRAAAIAHDVLMSALNGGQLALWLEAEQRGHLGVGMQKTWIATPGEQCAVCRSLHGTERPLRETWTASTGQSVQHPPIHSRCSCTIALVIT